MKLIHRITLLAFASAILMFALGGAAQAQAPIKIGASLSTTGSFAALGQNQLRGYQFCVKQTNEKGGVLGRKLELVIEDEQSQAATAVAICEKLITKEKVHAILGPYGSPSCLNGNGARVLQKSASELDELLREIGRILPGSIERGRGKKVVEET